MRAIRLLMGASVALALVTLAPGAEAREVACADAVRPSCPGFVCVDTNLNGRLDGAECMVMHCLHDGCWSPGDFVDPCAFQSDCCGGLVRPSFWCPEDA